MVYIHSLLISLWSCSTPFNFIARPLVTGGITLSWLYIYHKHLVQVCCLTLLIVFLFTVDIFSSSLPQDYINNHLYFTWQLIPIT